jgi:hypothetical protein
VNLNHDGMKDCPLIVEIARMPGLPGLHTIVELQTCCQHGFLATRWHDASARPAFPALPLPVNHGRKAVLTWNQWCSCRLNLLESMMLGIPAIAQT